MKHLEPEQRPVVLVFIYDATRVVRQPRDVQQRVGQHLQLFITQLRSFVLRCQPDFPEDLHPQVVAKPGEKGLVKEQAGKLPVAECGR